ncbi:hypothetical protein B5S30_g667 [[Candida] boidinii]|nr:hypothetical protein B5S30_g667 [[Candida] boidinii]
MDVDEAKRKLDEFNKSQFLKNLKRNRSSALSKTFDKIDGFLKLSESDYQSSKTNENCIINLYFTRLPVEYTKDAHTTISEIDKRYQVINYLLDNLISIHDMTPRKNDTDMISIPLYDMKIVGNLINTVVVEGIYPCLPKGFSIPLNKRRLKQYKVPLKLTVVPLDKSENILSDIVEKLIQIYIGKSDLKDLISVGVGFTDVLNCSIVLFINSNPNSENYIKFKNYIDILEKNSSTYNLLSIYTLLISNSNTNSNNQELYSKFHSFLIYKLSYLPYIRSDGVQSLIDLILGIRENDQIDVSKFDYIIKAIISKPKNISSKDYYISICDQLYKLLVSIDKPISTTISAHIIEKLYLKNSAIVRDFIFKKIWNCFNPTVDHNITESDSGLILTTAVDLNNSLNACLSLIRNCTSSDFLLELFDPLITPLWCFMAFLKKNSTKNNNTNKVLSYKVVEEIFIILFSIVSDSSEISNLLMDEIYNSVISFNGSDWEFAKDTNNLTYVKEVVRNLDRSSDERHNESLKLFNDVDFGIGLFTDLLKTVKKKEDKNSNIDTEDKTTSNDRIRFLFIKILKIWLSIDEKNRIAELEKDPISALVDLKFLEQIILNFKDDLISGSLTEILDIVKVLLIHKVKLQNESVSSDNSVQFIKQEHPNPDADSDDEDEDEQEDEGAGFKKNISNTPDETLSILFNLIDSIIEGEEDDSPLSSESLEILAEIRQLLTKLNNTSELMQMINSVLSKQERKRNIKSEDPNDELNAVDKKLYKEAISKINDDTPSVKIHGLNILESLILRKCFTITSYDDYFKNIINLIKEKDPFVHLKAIQSFICILNEKDCNLFPKLISIYNGKSRLPIEDKLKIGEIIDRFVHNKNNVLSKEYSNLIINSMLNVIGKHTAGDQLEELDLKLRISALSIIGGCCRYSLLNILDHLTDIYDCVYHVLLLEKDDKYVEIRIAALNVINNLIHSQDFQLNLNNGADYSGLAKIYNLLNNLSENDTNYLVKESSDIILDIIDELQVISLTNQS